MEVNAFLPPFKCCNLEIRTEMLQSYLHPPTKELCVWLREILPSIRHNSVMFIILVIRWKCFTASTTKTTGQNCNSLKTPPTFKCLHTEIITRHRFHL